MDEQTIDIVFDGPPGREGMRFIKVENHKGESINVGKWVDRPDGDFCALRLKLATGYQLWTPANPPPDGDGEDVFWAKLHPKEPWSLYQRQVLNNLFGGKTWLELAGPIQRPGEARDEQGLADDDDMDCLSALENRVADNEAAIADLRGEIAEAKLRMDGIEEHERKADEARSELRERFVTLEQPAPTKAKPGAALLLPGTVHKAVEAIVDAWKCPSSGVNSEEVRCRAYDLVSIVRQTDSKDMETFYIRCDEGGLKPKIFYREGAVGGERPIHMTAEPGMTHRCVGRVVEALSRAAYIRDAVRRPMRDHGHGGA